MFPAPLILLVQPGLDPLKSGIFLINHLVPMADVWSPYSSLTVPLHVNKKGFPSIEKWEHLINALLSFPSPCLFLLSFLLSD